MSLLNLFNIHKNFLSTPIALAGLTVLFTAAKLLIYAALAGGHLESAMCQWDCGWYLGIARHGYDVSTFLVNGEYQANWAFFPLYPMLVRAWAGFVGEPLELAGIVVSTTAFVAFVILGYRYRVASRVSPSPWIWLLLLITWPFSLFFHVAYSEALYAALSVGTLLLLVNLRPLGASVACAFLTGTRPTGILLAGWIGLQALGRACKALTLDEATRALLLAVIAPLGLIAFMALLSARTGDPLAFLHVQSGWHHEMSNPARVLWKFATPGLRFGRLIRAYFALWAVVGLFAAGWLAWRRMRTEAWVCASTVIMALTAGTLVGMPRFVAANPVFLLAIADLIEGIQSAALRLGIFFMFSVVQIFFVLAWYQHTIGWF
jgi:Mannosyltransferase (PIG-V)